MMVEFTKVNNGDDLKGMIHTLLDLQTSEVQKYVFRGISNDDQINPSLIRYYENKVQEKRQSLRYCENYLLETYDKYYHQFLPAYLNPVDFVASAQHYGIPTRLIDWTYNPFNALFFAVNEEHEKVKEYKILVANIYDNCRELNTFVGSRPRISNKESYCSDIPIVDDFYYFLEVMQGKHGPFCDAGGNYRFPAIRVLKSDPNRLLFCEVHNSNPRIVAQQGLFQIPLLLKKDENEKYQIYPQTKSQCEKIVVIKASLREAALAYLNCLGINKISLFPDLPSICEHIKNELPNAPSRKRA